MYLDEIEQELFDKTGTWISKSTICSEAKRMGLTRKKMRRIATQRSDIARAHFMVQVESTSADTFIWVDETGSDKCNVLRRYAYSLQSVTPCVLPHKSSSEGQTNAVGQEMAHVECLRTAALQYKSRREGACIDHTKFWKLV